MSAYRGSDRGSRVTDTLYGVSGVLAAGAAEAGRPWTSSNPDPLQFAHFPLPGGKQFVHAFPFWSVMRPLPLQL